MTLNEYINRKTPDYYPTMYQDGFTPTEILYAARKSMKESLMPEIDTYNIHITSKPVK